MRAQLLISGMMPKTKSLPFEWYNTPNIHLTTIKDFRRFCDQHDLEILSETDLVLREHDCRRIRACPNFFADYGIFVVRRKPL